MRHRIRTAFVIVASLVMAFTAGSCRRNGDSTNPREKSSLPASRGLPYELALLIPKTLYAGELRDTLDAILLGSTPGLPQHEPMFRLNVVYPDGHLTAGGFSGSHLTAWRTFRLRMLVDTASRVQLGVARDVIARPQVEIVSTAPTPHELAMLLSKERERITDILVEAELERDAAALRHKHSQTTAEALHKVTNGKHSVCVPPGLRSTKMGRDFLWTGTNLNDKDQNFIYYSYPWDGGVLTMDGVVAQRDSVMRKNIPGSQPGQWMQTARFDDRPLALARARTLNNICQLEVRGLWELRAGALGGPFVALARIDTASRRVVVAEGFVYSPHSPKRPLIRQMEAALRTFE